MGAVTVVEKVATGVVKGVENVVKFVEKNPTAAILDAAAIVTGNSYLVPYINAGNALNKGASPEDVAKTFAISYAAAQVTPNVGGSVAETTGSATAGSVAQGAAQGATSAALRGQDIVTGATESGLTTGLNIGLDKGATALNTPIYNQDNLNYTVPSELLPPEDTGGLPPLNTASWDVQPTDYSLTGDKTNIPMTEPGLNPAGSYTDLNMYSIQGQAPGLATMGGGSGLSTAMDDGTLSAAGYIDQTAMPALGDPGSFINNPNVTGQAVIPTPACAFNVDVPGVRVVLPREQQARQMRQRGSNAQSAISGICSNIPWLDTRAQMLKPIEIKQVPSPTGSAGGLSGATPHEVSTSVTPVVNYDLPGIEPELMDVVRDRGYHMDMARGGAVQHFACGSSAFGGSCAVSKYMEEYTPKFYSTKCAVLTATPIKRTPMGLIPLKQLTSQIALGGNMGGMAKGGLPAKYHEAAPKGHNPEFVTGITGYYAGGRGTGQSDDIPAMLHDGDYVIDAEAVSALGDGSSKAGNGVLMNFMKQVPHEKTVGGNPVPAKIADGEVVLPESFVTALGHGDNKRGARMLDEMRERLRAHKRSAPDTKIPPKARSPLEYIQTSTQSGKKS